MLPGGLRVVSEVIPGARSTAVGIWVGVGSRDETPSLAGASHFLEHLLFKGTAQRSALDIATAMDAVGGELNAFTSKEYTCFYARVLDEDLALAVEVICDMVMSSRLASVDVESERGVLLEEIAMHDDDPDDAVHEMFTSALWGDSPLGRPVIWSSASLHGISRAALAGFYRRRYRLPAMVVAAAGGVEHRALLRLVRAGMAGRLGGEGVPAPLRHETRRDRGRPRTVRRRRPSEQAHLVLGSTALPRRDPRRYALAVLDNALGGGMSSRLFQEVREKRGLVYSIYSFTSAFADDGAFGVYAGCAPAKVSEVTALCRGILDEVAGHGLTDQEVTRAKGQLRGSFILGLDDTDARMSRLGKGELAYGQLLGVDQVLAHIAAVTPDDVRSVAAEVLGRPRALAVVGPGAKRAG